MAWTLGSLLLPGKGWCYGKVLASANVPVNESELDFGLLHNDLALWKVLQKKFNNLQENRSQLE